MDPARQKEIASKGGKAAHAQGKAHKWDTHSAAEAGRKGGLARSVRLTKKVTKPQSGN